MNKGISNSNFTVNKRIITTMEFSLPYAIINCCIIVVKRNKKETCNDEFKKTAELKENKSLGHQFNFSRNLFWYYIFTLFDMTDGSKYFYSTHEC